MLSDFKKQLLAKRAREIKCNKYYSELDRRRQLKKLLDIVAEEDYNEAKKIIKDA